MHLLQNYRKMILSVLLISCVWLTTLDAANSPVRHDASIVESHSYVENTVVKGDVKSFNRDRTDLGNIFSSSYLTKKRMLSRQWNRSGLKNEFNPLFFRISAVDCTYSSNSKSIRKDGFRRWIVPVMITIGAGVTVYALYSIRGR